MNTTEDPRPANSTVDTGEAPATATPTGVKIVVNGRTVVHRHFLQDAMDAMVRRAVAEEAVAAPN